MRRVLVLVDPLARGDVARVPARVQHGAEHRLHRVVRRRGQRHHVQVLVQPLQRALDLRDLLLGRPEAEVEDEPRNDPAWRLSRFMAYGTFSEANTPSEPHWYLNMLATHPDWQRTGFGAALMGEVFAIADAEGLGCYLETETEENVAYYRRHGFEVRTEWDLMTDDENDRSQGPHQWGMWRQPR